MKALAEHLSEIEGGSLSFQVVGIARAHTPDVGLQTIHAFPSAEFEASGLILDLATDDVRPDLLGERPGDVQLLAHHARGARMREKGQEHA
ncbi:MAG: hypothetical protein NTW45_05660 [Rhodocyclales bacterium]|nr:hypothetical protein [Rhodocyclales bacterium]